MTEQLRPLQSLQIQLHEVNQELTREGVPDLAAQAIAAGSPNANETLPAAREDEETRHPPPRPMPPGRQSCPPGGAPPADTIAGTHAFLTTSSLPCRGCRIRLRRSRWRNGHCVGQPNQRESGCQRFMRRTTFFRGWIKRRIAMLRITTDEDPLALTLRLEGRLQGPWVEVLTKCWHGALDGSASRRRFIDLNGVTFIDGQGKARLAQMYAQGAEFIADEVMTKAIVAEIVGQ